MEKIANCNKVKIKENKRVGSSFCTCSSTNVENKICAVCECFRPNIHSDTAIEINRNLYISNVSLVDLMKECGMTLDKIIYLPEPYNKALKKENTFVRFTPRNYDELYKKRFSRKKIIELKNYILGTD